MHHVPCFEKHAFPQVRIVPRWISSCLQRCTDTSPSETWRYSEWCALWKKKTDKHLTQVVCGVTAVLFTYTQIMAVWPWITRCFILHHSAVTLVSLMPQTRLTAYGSFIHFISAAVRIFSTSCAYNTTNIYSLLPLKVPRAVFKAVWCSQQP